MFTYRRSYNDPMMSTPANDHYTRAHELAALVEKRMVNMEEADLSYVLALAQLHITIAEHERLRSRLSGR